MDEGIRCVRETTCNHGITFTNKTRLCEQTPPLRESDMTDVCGFARYHSQLHACMRSLAWILIRDGALVHSLFQFESRKNESCIAEKNTHQIPISIRSNTYYPERSDAVKSKEIKRGFWYRPHWYKKGKLQVTLPDTGIFSEHQNDVNFMEMNFMEMD